jgi:hypothetical protein
MTTAYTSLLGLALPVTGELSGTWGDTVNNSITSLLDTSVAGTTNVSTDTDVTLTTTTGAANTARQAILLFSGARTALRTVTAPAQSKIYTVINATTGGFSVKLVGVGPTTGVTIVAGESAVCAWNGSDFVKVSNTAGSGSFTNLTASGTVTFTGLTASQAVFTNASDELVSNAITGTGNVVMSASPTLTGTIGAAAATLSGNLTLSGGTANGVAYLNGSKVVTSGSALTFDGTSFFGGTNIYASGRFYAQRSSSSLNLPIAGYTDGSAGAVLSGAKGDIVAFGNAGGDGVIFANANTEQMRLTSTGLGIGTSSPAFKLDVQKGSDGTIGYFRRTGATINPALTIYSNETGNTVGFGTDYAGATSPAITFSIAASEKLRLDSSGNLGLGVTPSAWGSPVKAVQIGNSSFAGTTTQMLLSQNYVYDGSSDKYIANGLASQYYQVSGTHQWRIAPSGTAGNTITFTQAMTLDASGNLGIGTTSPSARLDVRNTSGYAAYIGGATYQFRVYTDTAQVQINDGVGESISFSPGSSYMAFSTGGSERARIDSSGNLLVGATSSSFNERIASISSSSYTYGSYRFGTGSEGHIIFVNGNGAVGSIFTNGSSTSFNTSSDYRLKNITGNLTGYKERLMSLQPKQGTWKADGSEFRGFLAHDFAVPYRASVTGEKDAVDEDGNPIMQAMQASSSEVMADLVAMVNELITENASLKARLDAANL